MARSRRLRPLTDFRLRVARAPCCLRDFTQMLSLEQLTAAVRSGEALDTADADRAARLLADAGDGGSAKRDFLEALAERGETAEEVAAFAAVFREMAVDPGLGDWAERAIDVCGTGGDNSGTFNISTAVGFLVAACGVPVFKHGNRSVTSGCGSADLLEWFGVRLDAPPEAARESMEALRFCFFFAPGYHPAFKHIMPVRKALAAEGKRSVFNLLGPLINPGRPAFQLLGVYAEHWVAPVAGALDRLGLSGGWVVHGRPAEGAGLDELSCAGDNLVAGFGRQRSAPVVFRSTDAGLAPCEPAELAGGTAEANAALLEGLFRRTPDVPKGLRDSVLLNAGTALWLAGAAGDVTDGVARARECVESGAAAEWLDTLRRFHQAAH